MNICQLICILCGFETAALAASTGVYVYRQLTGYQEYASFAKILAYANIALILTAIAVVIISYICFLFSTWYEHAANHCMTKKSGDEP